LTAELKGVHLILREAERQPKSVVEGVNSTPARISIRNGRQAAEKQGP
jgi:hypothetical protein